MNITYQTNTSSLDPVTQTQETQPEHPNTAYRPSPVFHMGSLAHTQKTPTNPGMVAQHGRAFPRDIKKDHLVFDAGSNPAHPIHIHENSPLSHPSYEGTTNHPAKEVYTNMDTRLQKTQNQQLENFLKKQPEIEGDQKQIFQALKEHGPATIEEIGNKIGKPQHTISGRFGELQEKGLIQVKGLTVNERGYKCKQYEVKQ